jgi:hypothetical protein
MYVSNLEAVALPVLDVLARAGETSLMEEFWQKLPHEKGPAFGWDCVFH